MLVNNTELLLSAMRSLWDIITPNVRKVSIELVDNVIILHFYYHLNPSEQEVELSEDAATEMIANFHHPLLIECQREIIHYPSKIKPKDFLVYSRYEPIITS